MVTKKEIREQFGHLEGIVSPKFMKLFNEYEESELSDRRNFTGHITASGTIVHFPSSEVLLLHHKTLDRWHVPGGHVDPEDESIIAAALRETEEETGLKANQLIPLNVINGIQRCVELNSHPIPYNEKKDEESHYHHDFRFVFAYEGDKKINIDSNESLNYKWLSIDDPYLLEILDPLHLKILIALARVAKFEKEMTDDVQFNQKKIIFTLGHLTRLYMEFGRIDLAEQTYIKAVRIGEQMMLDDKDSFLGRLAEYQCEVGKLTRNSRLAEQMFLASIENYKRYNGDLNSFVNILEVYKHLNSFYLKTGAIEKAEQSLDACKTLIQEKRHYSKEFTKLQIEFADAVKDHDLKERLYLSVLELCGEGLEEIKRITEVREKLVTLYIDRGQPEKTDRLIPLIVEGYESIALEQQKSYCESVAQSMELVGVRYDEQGAYEEAEKMYVRSAELYESQGNYHSTIGALEKLLELESHGYTLQDDVRDKLLSLCEKEIEHDATNEYIREKFAEFHYKFWTEEMNRYQLEAAKKFYLKILEAKKKFGKLYTSIYLRKIGKKLGAAFLNCKDLNASALPNLEFLELLKSSRDKFDKYKWQIPDYQFKLANEYARSGDVKGAENFYLEAIRNYKKEYDDEYETPLGILYALWNLALLYDENGALEKSIKRCEEGVKYCVGMTRGDDKEFASIKASFDAKLATLCDKRAGIK